jgi:hypothetical protein
VSARATGLALALWLVAGWTANARAEEMESTCVSCHAEEEEPELSAPVEEWRGSVHAAHEVSCDACHGGDPFEEEADLSMDEEVGYLGTPGWAEVPAFCGACHEDIQRAHAEGVLGQGLARGERVTVCSECHDAHAVVHPVPRKILTDERCGECAGLRDLVADMEDRFSAALGALDEIRSRIDTSLVHREVAELRERAVLDVHSFDRPRIEETAALARQRLNHLGERTRDLALEARFRRLIGFGVSGALLTLCLLTNRLSAQRRRGGTE